MDWINVISYGVAGGIGALLVYPFLGKKKERRVLYTLASLIAMYSVHSLFGVTVLPRLYEWQVDHELRKMQFYSELAQSSPQTYKKVKDLTLEGEMKSEARATVVARIAPLIEGVLPQYVATASDESVIAFIKVTTRELQELNRSNPDSCYFFMYPQKAATPYASTMDGETDSRLLDAMGAVIHSATHNPQPPPDKQESAALLQTIAGQLAQTYGADVQLLRGNPRDTTERGKVCTMAIDLYSRTLSLPPREGSELLRYLLSPQ